MNVDKTFNKFEDKFEPKFQKNFQKNFEKNFEHLENPNFITELTTMEIDSVSGGFDAWDGFEIGGTLGTVGGAAFTGTTIGATRFGLIGAALGFAAGAGWGLGSLIYSIRSKPL